jgi:hypothetical protein
MPKTYYIYKKLHIPVGILQQMERGTIVGMIIIMEVGFTTTNAISAYHHLWLFIFLFDHIKGILSTKIVIFSYPKLLSFSVLTFIK